MDVVGHDDPGGEFVEASFDFTDDDCASDNAGNPGVLKPQWSRDSAVQNPILGQERMAGCAVHNGFFLGWQRSPKAPGKEEAGIVGMKMR